MGPLEIVVVLLIAFIFLGPQRMVDAARLLGKASRELKRMSDELPRLVVDDEDSDAPQTPSNKSDRTQRRDSSEENGLTAADGPVAFRRRPNADDSTELREQG